MASVQETATDVEDASKSAARPDATASILVPLATVVLTYWTIDIISPALPEIQDDLALSAAGAGLVWSLLFAGRLIGNIPAAMLVDRIGDATTAAGGGVLLGAGSILAALSSGATTLYPARVLQGLGVSLLVNAALRSLVKSRPGQGSALTLFGFASTLGGVFGLQVGGIVTEALGWRSIFAVASAIAGVLVAMSIVAHSRSRDGIRNRDQRDVSSPALPWRSVGLPIAGTLLVYVNYSLFVSVPLYAERRFDSTPEDNANLLLVITVVHIVASFPIGRAIRRWGSERIFLIGLAITAVGIALILPAPNLLWLIPGLTIYGVGQIAAGNASGDMVIQRAGRSGRAVGAVRLSSDFGLVIGPYVMGSIADFFGYRAPFVALPILTVCFGLIALRYLWSNSGSVQANSAVR
ncbi:MAG TPA: MFS transporter [Thermomicrobiales bacterium]